MAGIISIFKHLFIYLSGTVQLQPNAKDTTCRIALVSHAQHSHFLNLFSLLILFWIDLCPRLIVSRDCDSCVSGQHSPSQQ